tara:strand:+ start:105 stop:548 length:444 start_codon:yes stop_codon:yes gene_type:complete
MNSCGYNQNEISLDANEISNLVFSSDDIEKDYLDSMLNSFKTLDLKTYFEMLLIVTTEGLKKHYGNSNQKVNITNLNSENIQFLNSFMKKIKVELNVDIVSYNDWNLNENLRKIDFRKLVIFKGTTLNDLFFILDRDAYIIISFNSL